jgi:hypothetical protein
MLMNWRRGYSEVLVEHRENLVWTQFLRDRGKAFDIGEQDSAFAHDWAHDSPLF